MTDSNGSNESRPKQGTSSDTEIGLGKTMVSGSERYCPSCDSSFPTTIDRCPTDGTALVELSEDGDSLIGLEIDGRFTIKRRLGKGGMGAAYAAVQHSIGREVAIKVIHPHLARDRMGARRFLRETKLASQLSHPNTVTVLDFGQTDADAAGQRRLYMAMELVKGPTLSAVLREQGTISATRTIDIARQICDALGAAHRLDIVHRDLKPSNVMLEATGRGTDRVRVLDFGLAKSLAGDDSTVTESNAIVGTPQYISPELIVGDAADTRSDLYSLGAMLYELVSGKPPFDGESVQACLFSQVHDAPPPLSASVPNGLADIVLRLLAKRPELRYQSAEEVTEALDAFELTLKSNPTSNLTSNPTQRAAVDPVAATVPQSAAFDPPASAVAGGGNANTDTGVRRWPVMVAALGLLLAGVTTFVLVRGGGVSPVEKSENADDADDQAASTSEAPGPELSNTDETKPPVAASVMDAGPVESDASTDADAPRTVRLRITSTPKRARVRGPNRQSCTTPCVLEVRRGDKPVKLTFSRSGYHSERTELIPKEDTDVGVELKRRKKPSDGFVQPYE